MTALRIYHRTSYRFAEPVTLWPHRLLLRPRESCDLRLVSSNVTVTPAATLSWAQDVFGNTIATASFQTKADHLVIDSIAEIILDAAAWPVFPISGSAISYPFRYEDDEWTDLGGLAAPQYPDPPGRLQGWARGFIGGDPTDTLSLLKDLSASVAAQFRYQSRDDEGTQTPVQTLDRGSGSCRDFAVLFAEATRTLGFGARIVSGYLYNPDQQSMWVGRRRLDARLGRSLRSGCRLDHVRSDQSKRRRLQPDSGGGRTRYRLIMPVTGSFHGMTNAFQGMSVEVQVSSVRRSSSRVQPSSRSSGLTGSQMRQRARMRRVQRLVMNTTCRLNRAKVWCPLTSA